MPTQLRRGRRPGSPDTRSAILAVAREQFAAGGYAGTSVRGIAAAAGVDAALVHHYFGTKEDLFVAALELKVDPREALAPVVAGGVDGAGERLLRTFFMVWEDEEARLPPLALIRGVFDPGGQRLLREGMFRLLMESIGRGLDIDQPERRLTLVLSQLVGIVMLRYVVQVEPLASAPVEELVATYAPVLQGYLSDPLP